MAAAAVCHLDNSAGPWWWAETSLMFLPISPPPPRWHHQGKVNKYLHMSIPLVAQRHLCRAHTAEKMSIEQVFLRKYISNGGNQTCTSINDVRSNKVKWHREDTLNSVNKKYFILCPLLYGATRHSDLLFHSYIKASVVFYGLWLWSSSHRFSVGSSSGDWLTDFSRFLVFPRFPCSSFSPCGQ